MTKRAFRAILSAAVGALLLMAVLAVCVLYGRFVRVQRTQLREETALAAQGVSCKGKAYLESCPFGDLRATWIAAGGTVLFDSAVPEEKENHLDRPEIQMALAAGYGESDRYSATLMERSFYAARRLEDGTVLRLSVTRRSVVSALSELLWPCAGVLCAAALVSLLLAVRLSRQVVEPLNRLDLDDPLSNDGVDELAPLLRRIHSQQEQLHRQEEALEQKQDELDTITGSMQEGMVLLNRQGEIVSINPAAQRLLDVSENCAGRELPAVNRDPGLSAAVEKALDGKPFRSDLRLGGRIYRLNADPVISEGAVLGAALVLFDVTEREQAEQLRREFTANVSHELKTPLHAISGYAELLRDGIAAPEDAPLFAARIYDETGRLVRLVEDIISLSRLEEGDFRPQTEETDLAHLAAAVLRSLEPEAQAAGVTLELRGGPAILRGDPKLLYSMIRNLCDNAIKYNHAGGRVTVETARRSSQAVLTVSDTGIGIAPEDRQRVFERFYRVDKGRSRASGGTGLGLSIVKHAVRVHGGEVRLQSALGEGTVFTVLLPENGGEKG